MGVFTDIEQQMTRGQRTAALLSHGGALLLGRLFKPQTRLFVQPLLDIGAAYVTKQTRKLPPPQAGYVAPGISKEAAILWMDEDENRQMLADGIASAATDTFTQLLIKGDVQQILASELLSGQLSAVLVRYDSKHSRSGNYDLMNQSLMAKEIETFFMNKLNAWDGPLPSAENESIFLKIASQPTMPPTVLTQKWDKMWDAEQAIDDVAQRPLHNLMVRLAKACGDNHITNIEDLRSDPQSPLNAQGDDDIPPFRHWADQELTRLTAGGDNHQPHPGVLRDWLRVGMDLKAKVPEYKGATVALRQTTTTPEPSKQEPLPPITNDGGTPTKPSSKFPDATPTLPIARQPPQLPTQNQAQAIAQKMLVLALLQRGYDAQMPLAQKMQWGVQDEQITRIQGWDAMAKAYPSLAKALDAELVQLAKLGKRDSIFTNSALNIDPTTQNLLQNFTASLATQIQQTTIANNDYNQLATPINAEDMLLLSETQTRPAILKAQTILRQGWLQNSFATAMPATSRIGTVLQWQKTNAMPAGRLVATAPISNNNSATSNNLSTTTTENKSCKNQLAASS